MAQSTQWAVAVMQAFCSVARVRMTAVLRHDHSCTRTSAPTVQTPHEKHTNWRPMKFRRTPKANTKLVGITKTHFKRHLAILVDLRFSLVKSFSIFFGAWRPHRPTPVHTKCVHSLSKKPIEGFSEMLQKCHKTWRQNVRVGRSVAAYTKVIRDLRSQ